MNRILAGIVCAGVASLLVMAKGAAAQVEESRPLLSSAIVPGGLSPLPPLPRGKSTILGGEIRGIDFVRDELTLKALGERPIKILFDERTQVYRDGSRIALRDLGPVDHASVQTLLDGADVYALSIHLLSSSPEGEYRGQVLSYNPSSRELSVSSVLFKDPVRLLLSENTQITRVGQAAFASIRSGTSDLVSGALISVKFQSNKEGSGVARQIEVLATPGASFVFSGNISSLDMHAGRFSVADPRDGITYEIAFDASSLAESKDIHVGDRVSVNTVFDGAHYVANAIHVN